MSRTEFSSVLPSDGLVSLESVLYTEELDRRPSRPPDCETENRALVALAQALADSPPTILQKMAEIMLETFRAGSSGFSLLTKDDGGKRFHWPAIAGVWKPHIGGGTPRDFGPCGDVLDRNAPLLFRHFERRYTYFQPVTPPVEECLLVPFCVEGKAVGTIWVIAHDDRRKFDAEDLRLLVSMGRFASSAYQSMAFHEKTLAINEALMLGSVRQHEFTEAADSLNTQLQSEINDRKQAELELSEKARLLDLSNDAIIVQDLDHKISSWNKGAEQLYGWSAEEAMGKDLHSLLQTQFPKPIEEIIADLQRKGHFSGEFLQTTRDGRRMSALCRKVLDRETKSLLTSYTDITERRLLEETLLARAADLLRADRAKDEFLAMLAHELRNPLAPLRNAVEILQTPEASADECAQAQHIIGRQIENMSRMIDDLLDVSRITEGKIELRRKPVALEAILLAATNLAQFAIAARSQELTVSLPSDPVFLDADATRLEQVFTNLLGNACKYCADGCRIQLCAERAAGIEPPEVIVRVRDDGIGIAPEMLPRVFDLFAQASRTLDRAQGGLGIGLTLVQRLVRLHGGSVEACSDGLGCGSEFIVHLPILREAPPPLILPPVPNAPETPRRILIVDDSADAARTLAILQRRRGHETRTAFTGPDAVAVAAEFLPEVVLLDIGLPGMDGFEVARRLRAMPALAGVAIAAMTGYGSAEDRVRGKQAGFDEYLVKPLDLSYLREWIGSRN